MFEQSFTNKEGYLIKVTTSSYAELIEVAKKLQAVGWSPCVHYQPVHGNGTKSPSSNRQPTNTPPNVKPCHHHPDVGMGHDKNNPGQYYCRGKVGDKWCGYKADKNGQIRPSILDKEETEQYQVSYEEMIDF